MVDYYGNWTAEDNYNVYPKNKWCDCDYVASWIKDLGYKSKTSIENLVEMILAHYFGYLYDEGVQFFIDNMKKSENDPMISIEDVKCFVESCGGLKEFDYEC